ncbi:MAG: hypothetical protein COA84_00715 [Robiginitomaculum sp.]|nr:MAG: hypothetical protein COA84_00715 [Robiginitomaculum sp.]
MDKYANLVEAQEIEEAKSRGKDAMFSFINEMAQRVQGLHSDFVIAHDQCGILLTGALYNNFYRGSLLDPKAKQKKPHYLAARFNARTHQDCHYTGDEIANILASTYITEHPTMGDKAMLSLLSEHYQVMAEIGQDVPSCPVTFMLVLMALPEHKPQLFNALITQKVRSCIEDEPDPEKRKVIITVLDNVES